MSDEVLYDVRNGVAVLTLNRPERRNAFTMTLIHRWADLLEAANADDAVRAIVVTGAGGAFCAGIDLDVLASLDPSALTRRDFLTDEVHRVARAVERSDKPIIAAVSGAAVGAGMDMALMCDMRIVGPSTSFAASYVRLGLVPGDGGCYYLPRLVGVAKALELLLTGDAVSGTEAAALGLANHVVADDEVLPFTVALAERIAAQPPISVKLIRRTVYQSQDIDLRTSLDLIASHMGVIMTTDDHQEALAAFREKRPGTFTGK
ncbi:MAG: enoyl-CoA hydratase-related protein [Candidatus Nanopelagicales bacterium]|nr:enoyl-CoA hydratase-related protein [Candidatus Nanopelagicales bacterium]